MLLYKDVLDVIDDTNITYNRPGECCIERHLIELMAEIPSLVKTRFVY